MNEAERIYVEESIKRIKEYRSYNKQIELEIGNLELRKINQQQRLNTGNNLTEIYIQAFNLWAKEHNIESIEMFLDEEEVYG